MLKRALVVSLCVLGLSSCGGGEEGQLELEVTGVFPWTFFFASGATSACADGAVLCVRNKTDTAVVVSGLSIMSAAVIGAAASLTPDDFSLTIGDSAILPDTLDAKNGFECIDFDVCTPWDAWRGLDTDGDGQTMSQEEESAELELRTCLEGHFADGDTSLRELGECLQITGSVRNAAP